VKKTVLLTLCCALLWPLAGCSKRFVSLLKELQNSTNAGSDEDFSFEADAVKFEDTVVYHNTYLGFSYAAPKGWWLYSLNGENFSEDAEETADPTGLDIYYGEEGDYIDLISFANLQFSNMDNHLGFDISAETVTGIDDLAGYMEYFEEYMLEPEEDTRYSQIGASRITIGSFEYEQRIFGVYQEDNEYNILTLTRPVTGGFFLTITASYWPANKNAVQSIINAITKAT
jgi:hypothetical protein